MHELGNANESRNFGKQHTALCVRQRRLKSHVPLGSVFVCIIECYCLVHEN